MHRNVTAIYRTHEVAETVRRQLEEAGISRTSIHVIPDARDSVEPGTYRDHATYGSYLDGIGLPEDERHTYEQAVRRGDHVVSVRIDDDDKRVDHICEVMRHPEAYEFDHLDREFATVDPYDRPYSATTVGRRDADLNDPYVRGYRYE